MRGLWRVITFCLLTTIVPCMLIILPLYLRNVRYADVMYRISDSDVIQIHKGQSSIFCQKHSLKMNSSFNAFQMRGRPEITDKRRHIRLKKSMSLPDDTLEYWGFYLFNGATVELKACSSHKGAKILVVKGEKIFDTCGILEGDKVYKKDISLLKNQGEVFVTLEKPQGERVNASRLIKIQQAKIGYLNAKNISSINELEKRVDSYTRQRRNANLPLHNPNTILDAGVNHGGNALTNSSKPIQESSASSFENNLHVCYRDDIVMNEFIPHSPLCNETKYLEITTILKVIYNVSLDGYYYYIFYSDNNFVINDIHAIFDIYKPTFQYTNSKACVNKTECEFDIAFLSDESVVVEVPTKNGLKNDDEYSTILISVCHPRVSIYIIFPVTVLLLILTFAFL